MTTEKTIDELIDEVEKQLNQEPITGEQLDIMIEEMQKQLDAYQEPPSRAEQIDTQIKSLQEQIDGCNETYLTKIEKAIDEEKNIISHLIDEQLKHQTRMEELQEIQQLMQL